MTRAKVQKAVRALWDVLDRQYEPQRVTTRAWISSVSKDSSGRIVSASGVVDGATGRRVRVPYGVALGVGSVVEVTNMGSKTMPDYAMTRASLGMPGSMVSVLTDGGGITVVSPAGLPPSRMNYLTNPDGSLKQPGHVGTVAWESSDEAIMSDAVGED